MATQLNHNDTEALRVLADHGPDKLADYDTAKLGRAGMITAASRGDGTYELTGMGQRWLDRYVEQTGDGPEALKALFVGALGPRR
jgi:hypothetical protein